MAQFQQFEPQTERQAWYIEKLTAERDCQGNVPEALLTYWSAGYPSKREASDAINALLRMPKLRHPDPAPPKPQVEEGWYELDGEIYHVVPNKAGTGRYAMHLVMGVKKPRWEYEKGAVSRLAGLAPLTVEVAAQFGKSTGFCCICFRKLTRQESIQAGIGPVCAGKVGA